jgi:hypothetical protein
VDFYDPTGTLVATKPFKVDSAGNLTVPGSSFPPTTTAPGSKVVYNTPGNASPPVKWQAAGSWIWSTTAGSAFVDPLGLPGFTSPQSWFIDQSGLQIMSGLTSEESLVSFSNFDLAYTDLGSGLFSAAITGNDSYMKLADSTFISFPDQTPFGDLQYLFNDGVSANGTFDFTAIGFSGPFDWSAGSNYASGTASSFSEFQAPSVVVTPEPRQKFSTFGHRSIRSLGNTSGEKVTVVRITQKTYLRANCICRIVPFVEVIWPN